jgi:hypothetical protein
MALTANTVDHHTLETLLQHALDKQAKRQRPSTPLEVTRLASKQQGCSMVTTNDLGRLTSLTGFCATAT